MKHPNQKKYVLLLIVSIMMGRLLNIGAQNCYIPLDDASGNNTNMHLNELQAVAAELCAIFDSIGFEGTFKVYDFGFYLHQENSNGSYPQVFEKKIEEIQSATPYYLLFGKQTDKDGIYTKLWLSLKLPLNDSLLCLTEVKSREIEFHVENVLSASYQAQGDSSYYKSEIEAMNFLKNAIIKINICCQTGDSNCKIIECPSKAEMKEILERKGFRKIPIEILGAALTKPSNTALRSNILGSIVDSAGLQIKIKGEVVNLSDDFLTILNRSGQNFKCFITKEENICPGNYFARAESDFMTPSESIGAIWFHIFDDEIDYLYIKWIEYGRQKSDIFGLEHIFYQEGYFPYNGNSPNPPLEDRVINIDNNGFIINVVPHIDISSPGTIGTLNRIPKIKTNNNETILFNDPGIDDKLVWRYYEELVLSPSADVTDIQEVIIFERNGFTPNCHKGQNPSCRLYCTNYPFFYNYSQSTINQFYSDGGIVGMGWLERLYFAKTESPDCGKMDYWCRYLTGAYKLPSTASPLPCPHQYYLMEKEALSPYYRFSSMGIAYNMKDFGNFIWGGAMKKLGFTKEDALHWADFNEWFTDSPADKRAISAGYDNINN